MVHLAYHLVAERHKPPCFWCCSSSSYLVYLPLGDRRTQSRLGVGRWTVRDGSAQKLRQSVR